MKQIRKRIAAFLLSCVMSVMVFGVSGGVTADAVDTDITLRVGLYYDSTALSKAQLENADGTGYTLGYYDDMTFVSLDSVSNTAITMQVVSGSIQVSDSDSGTVLYTAPSSYDNLAIRPNGTLTWFKGYKWYGDFVYRQASGGSISVINYVGLEDYVKGVLPYEMSASWSIEALKAQAVCARSYALGNLDKHASSGFDLCNTTSCQVYLGANLSTSNSDAAVDATKGQYLTYNGKLAVGYFFSSDGGATEDASNVWGGDYGYLKGKVDPYEDTENALNAVWSITLSAAEIKEKLQSAGYSIGDVTNVEVTKRTATNNVNEVTVTDASGTKVVISQSSVRTVFGVNSIRYTITPDTAIKSAATSNATITKAQNSLNAVALSSHKVSIDGLAVSPQAYLINGENYFKLRDIAYIMNDTETQFNVNWDAENNTIRLTSNTPYDIVGGEMTQPVLTEVQSCTTSTSVILLDGKYISLTGYRINGNNYYRIRDLSTALGFGVDFNADTMTVLITSSGDMTDDPETGTQEKNKETSLQLTGIPTKYTFDGTGWGHSVGMSQYGALAMAKQGFTYDEILKFYYTDISISK